MRNMTESEMADVLEKLVLHRKLASQSGAPKFNIPKCMLENLLEEGFTIQEIFEIICVAERTI